MGLQHSEQRRGVREATEAAGMSGETSQNLAGCVQWMLLSTVQKPLEDPDAYSSRPWRKACLQMVTSEVMSMSSVTKETACQSLNPLLGYIQQPGD